jgi:hypothetical protein
VLSIASPDSGGMSDLEAVPNPVIHSCQVLDPGRDVRRFEVSTEVMKRAPDGLQPFAHLRRRSAGPGARTDRGSGHQHRHAARRARPDGSRTDRGDRLPRLAAALAGVRRTPPPRRALGATGIGWRGSVTRRGTTHRTANSLSWRLQRCSEPPRSQAPTGYRARRRT